MQQGVKTVRKELLSERDSRGSRLRTNQRSVLDHGFDWLDASDGLLRERETESDGTEQFTVDIDRAAAHTLENARFGQRTAAKPGQDDGLLWAEILEDTEDLDLEIFDAVALEDSFANASKSGSDILDWEKILTGGKRD